MLTLTCENLGAELEGICRHQGMAVFVPGLLPGETAEVRIVKVEKRYAFGRMEHLCSEPSADRKAPGCAAYPKCGGCTGRHMSYEATLRTKREQVQNCFSRIGGMDVEVLPTLGMDRPEYYRNKTAMPVGGTAEAPVLGFFAPRSHRLIPVDFCPNAMHPADKVAGAFLKWIREAHVAPYDEATHSGLLRHLVVRVNRAGEAMATVVVNGNRIPHQDGLISALREAGCISVILNENTKQTNVIFGPRFRTLYGTDTLDDELCGLRFSLSPDAFLQVNPTQAEVLYQTTQSFAELKADDILCDVYCGAGTITLTMAQHCKKAVGIEIVPAAVENARKNAVRNGIHNVSFYCGAAEEMLPKLVDEGLRPDVIVVDPPRKGLEQRVIDAIAAAAPERVVYVSCNPATLARDAALLSRQGYRVVRAQPVDLFCWTSGVETACLLSRV